MSWTRKLSGLPGLSEDDKGRALKLILDRPKEDRELLLSGSTEQAVASVRELLKASQPSSSLDPHWAAQLHSELSGLSSRELAQVLLLLAGLPLDVRADLLPLLSCGNMADRRALVRALIKQQQQQQQQQHKTAGTGLAGGSVSNVMCTIS